MNCSVFTFAQRRELRAEIDRIGNEAWSAFLMHNDIRHWNITYDLFPDFQVLLCDSMNELIAVGNAVPFIWDGSLSDLPSTIEETLLRAEWAHKEHRVPNTASALSVVVRPEQRGRNRSSRVIQAMKLVAQQHACTAFVVPVRPVWKSRYPLTPMDRYVQWKRDDGTPLDPWLRVHWRLGARPLCVAPNTLTVEGTVDDWEKWTGMTFPESGLYVISGALQPVKIDRERNVGKYEDPNYWMQHPL